MLGQKYINVPAAGGRVFGFVRLFPTPVSDVTALLAKW